MYNGIPVKRLCVIPTSALEVVTNRRVENEC